MKALVDALSHIVDLWPLFVLAFGITAAGVRVMIRQETRAISKDTKNNLNKKLYKEDGSLIYMPRTDYLKGIETMVSDMDLRCQQHRDACRSTLCMKMDGVLVKLDKMDEKRNEARKERNIALDKHAVQISTIGKDVSKLIGRFDTLEKTVINNGIHKVH